MPPVTLTNDQNWLKTADMESRHLVALINRMVDYNTPEDESSALFEVLYACQIPQAWIDDARHFSWSPVEGPRPKFAFAESYGLPRI
jgi:hypothetical protein